MSELDVQRRLTRAFIATAPVEVTLIPEVKTATGSGGYTTAPGPARAPQTFKLIEPADSGAEDPVRASTGVSRYISDYMLLGEHDADIDIDDTFVLDGNSYRVVELLHPNGYEARARVARTDTYDG